MTNIAKTLQTFAAFSDFSIEELRKISSILSLRNYFSGEIFAKQGECNRSFYILLAGVVTEFHHSKGAAEKTITQRFSSGTLFGLASILDQGPRSVSCRAEEDITIAECSIADYQCLDDAPDPIFSKFQFTVAIHLASDVRKSQLPP